MEQAPVVTVIDPRGRSYALRRRMSEIVAKLLADEQAIEATDNGKIEVSWGSRGARVTWRDKEIG